MVHRRYLRSFLYFFGCCCYSFFAYTISFPLGRLWPAALAIHYRVRFAIASAHRCGQMLFHSFFLLRFLLPQYNLLWTNFLLPLISLFLCLSHFHCFCFILRLWLWPLFSLFCFIFFLSLLLCVCDSKPFYVNFNRKLTNLHNHIHSHTIWYALFASIAVIDDFSLLGPSSIHILSGRRREEVERLFQSQHTCFVIAPVRVNFSFCLFCFLFDSIRFWPSQSFDCGQKMQQQFGAESIIVSPSMCAPENEVSRMKWFFQIPIPHFIVNRCPILFPFRC